MLYLGRHNISVLQERSLVSPDIKCLVEQRRKLSHRKMKRVAEDKLPISVRAATMKQPLHFSITWLNGRAIWLWPVLESVFSVSYELVCWCCKLKEAFFLGSQPKYLVQSQASYWLVPVEKVLLCWYCFVLQGSICSLPWNLVGLWIQGLVLAPWLMTFPCPISTVCSHSGQLKSSLVLNLAILFGSNCNSSLTMHLITPVLGSNLECGWGGRSPCILLGLPWLQQSRWKKFFQ